MSDRRRAVVRWAGRGRVFEGRTDGGAAMLLDSDSEEGPSPTEALLMATAGCMALDVKHILEKGRSSVEEVEIEISGDRAEDPPRRFTALRMTIRVKGPGEDELPKVDRAVQLSRETYCSVLHTLRPDLSIEMSTELR